MDVRNRYRTFQLCAQHRHSFLPSYPGLYAGFRPYTAGPEPQPSTTTTPPSPSKGRFAAYRQALNALAERTRTPLPSLIFSFAVLHELTAIVPFAGIFLAMRTLNVGERVLKSFPNKFMDEAAFRAPHDTPPEELPDFWVRLRRRWWLEGRLMAERVGRRYGIFGFSKNGTEGDGVHPDVASRQEPVLKKAVPDILNFSIAYLVTKSLLPVRVGLCLYWSPPFSRRVIEPTRMAIMRLVRRASTCQSRARL
ncbi:uncharacterized protein B0H18DRAFT_875280 [Fomitopsis serialis]|uniref:uncharacterized protein n=1 Tax=Fomitopsis serialis TaxID=139415 RepID=UPI002007B6B4|nr:uncharacterized protein B0H18DRAFT_875280 [Neoantrodia serialis]KAH9927833.1 hypothetical protein B0H18DRAFT_875280 [Neoantrodia serialis]